VPRTIVDSSALVEFFNRGDSPLAGCVSALIEDDDAVLTRLIRCEVLAGFRADRVFRRAENSLAAFEVLDDGRPDVCDRAIAIFRTCRKQGITVRSIVDCLVAATALANDLPVIHRDRDFDAIAGVFPLRVLSVIEEAESRTTD